MLGEPSAGEEAFNNILRALQNVDSKISSEDLKQAMSHVTETREQDYQQLKEEMAEVKQK